MSLKLGAIIDAVDAATTDRKPDAVTAPGTTNADTDSPGIARNVATPIAEPEIIAGYESADPDTLRFDAGNQPKRRGRKPGSRNRTDDRTSVPQTANAADSLVDLTGILLSLHTMGAALLGIQELELDKLEAKAMADATREVMRHYPVAIDPKKIAIANLVIVCGGIYGTRAMAWRARVAMESRKERLTVIGNTAPQSPQQARRPAPTGEAKAHVNGEAKTQPAMLPSELWPGGVEDFI